MLTSVQLTALQTNLASNANTILISGTPVAIKDLTAAQKGNSAIAQAVCDQWYNLIASPAFYGNYNNVPVASIRGAITWAKLTSNAAMPTSPSTDLAPLTWVNQCLSCQANLEMLLGLANDGTFDATQHSQWQGLKDCLSAVPSKANGTTQDAGWASVQTILCRLGTYAEKLFADTTNGTGASNITAASFGPFQGGLSNLDIQAAWNGHY